MEAWRREAWQQSIVQDETSTRPISYRPLHGRVSLSRSREVGYFQSLLSLWTPCFFALGPRSRRLPLRTLLFVFHGWISLGSVTKSRVYDSNLWILSFHEQWTLLWPTRGAKFKRFALLFTAVDTEGGGGGGEGRMETLLNSIEPVQLNNIPTNIFNIFFIARNRSRSNVKYFPMEKNFDLEFFSIFFFLSEHEGK